MHRTPRAADSSSPLLSAFVPLLLGLQDACAQQRTWQRVLLIWGGTVLNFGCQRLSQVIVAIGHGPRDWSAWYRLLNRGRIDWDRAHGQLVEAVCADLRRGAPFVVGLDATHLPRTGKRMPGIGWGRNPFNPAWKPGIWRCQRWVGLSALLPRSADGCSRAVPLRFTLAPPPNATAGVEPCTEWAAGLQLVRWVRTTLDGLGQRRPVLVVGDGAYANTKLLKELPAHTWLLARCAKNRAMWALPGPQPARGRKRRYGDPQPTPHARLTDPATVFESVTIAVRGRTVRLQVHVSDPLLLRPVPDRPVILLVIGGVKESASHRRREATYVLVTAVATGRGEWRLPLPLAELVSWAWQRWELEVMHRAIKSGFGLGQQQQWSVLGATGAVHWIAWLAAALTLSGYRAWGWGPQHDGRAGRWWHPPRWTLATCLSQLRAEVWQLGPIQPVWPRTTQEWHEMLAPFAPLTHPARGYQRG